LGIDTLLYAGVVTNACVFLSAASGFDLGYRQYLITDCTAALSDKDQASAERFIGSYIAELVTAEQVLSALDKV
jgi:nicotinamidase-related amidase